MLKQDRIPRKYQLEKTFKVLLPTSENWKRSFPLKDPKVNYWYSDGSGANDRYGTEIYGPRNNHRESIHLGKLLASHGLPSGGIGHPQMCRNPADQDECEPSVLHLFG